MQESSNNLLVSIIIPAYNAEKYIAETINSVISQTHKNIECIIINDGSTDNTQYIVENFFSNKYSFIKIITIKNHGVSFARNLGLKNSKGDFIVFLDADDILQPNDIELKLNHLIKNDYDLVYSSCEIIDEKSIKTGLVNKGTYNFTLEDVLQWKANYITIPSGYLYKKSILKLINGFNNELSNNADQELLMRLLYNKARIGYLSDVTWLYRRHSKNMSSNILTMEKDTLKTYNLAVKQGFFNSNSFKNLCFASMYIILAGSWWKEGNNKLRGLYYIIKAFLIHPIYTIKIIFKKL